MAACAAAATTCLSVWHSVPERASYGTEYACRAQKGLLGYATHFQRHSVYENPLFLHGRRFQRNSVLKTGSYGTEEIFGAKNRLLWYATHFQRRAVPKAASCRTGRIFKGPQNSRLHRLWTASCGTRCVFRGPRCMKTPSCRTGRIFSARNSPHSLCSLRPLPPFPSSR